MRLKSTDLDKWSFNCAKICNRINLPWLFPWAGPPCVPPESPALMGRGQNKECSASGYIFVRRVILVHFMFPGSCVGPRQTHSSFMEDPGESAPCSETGLGETNTISNLSAVSRGCEKKKEKHFLQSIRPLFSLCSNLIIAAPISHDLWPRRLLGTDRSIRPCRCSCLERTAHLSSNTVQEHFPQLVSHDQ